MMQSMATVKSAQMQTARPCDSDSLNTVLCCASTLSCGIRRRLLLLRKVVTRVVVWTRVICALPSIHLASSATCCHELKACILRDGPHPRNCCRFILMPVWHSMYMNACRGIRPFKSACKQRMLLCCAQLGC